MCILFIYINPDPKPGEYKVILASNRDEVYDRPAKPAHEWANHQGVYGGQDMQPGKEGGTWLTVNKHGRIGVLLNIGQSKEMDSIEQTSRRGFYAVEWVTDMSKDIRGVFQTVKDRHGDCAHTFRLAVFDIFGDQKAGTLTRGPDKARGYEVDFLPSGIHILGNNAPGVTWRKVEESRKRFEDIVQQAAPLNDRRLLLDKLIQLLTNRERHWPDPGIAGQMSGKPDEVLACLSSIYVQIGAVYGTRTHSVFLVDWQDRAFFYERTMAGPPEGQAAEWIESCHEFNLERPATNHL